MTMGTGLVLIAIGAILRYAVQDSINAVDLPTVGLILMIVGAVALVIGVFYTFGQRTRRTGRRHHPATRVRDSGSGATGGLSAATRPRPSTQR